LPVLQTLGGTISLSEFFDSAGRINEFLLTGKERMALAAYLNANILFRGTRLDYFATGARNRRLFVVRMDFLFHH
jgi:hypothetical protein